MCANPQTPFSPNMALRRTYEWAGSHFHPIYVRRFIQCLGIYPIGGVGVLVGLAMYLPFYITLTYGVGCFASMGLERRFGRR